MQIATGVVELGRLILGYQSSNLSGSSWVEVSQTSWARAPQDAKYLVLNDHEVSDLGWLRSSIPKEFLGENLGGSVDATSFREVVRQSALPTMSGPGLVQALKIFLEPSDLLRKQRQVEWTDERILAAIQKAAEYDFPLTAKAYSDLVYVGEVLGPSVGTITRRYRTWADACEAAGVVAAAPTRPLNFASRWSDADILGVVRRYLADPTSPSSMAAYDAWKQRNAPDGPSSQTIRLRFGQWSNVKTMVDSETWP